MNSFHVLMVEDNPADADLTRETLEAGRFQLVLSVAADGEEAMSFLRKQGRHAGERRPDLILLDLNIPKQDGRRVLAEAKGDPELRTIPVIVLTSSDAERDIAQCYLLGANCYLTKPVDLHAYQAIVQSVENFWLALAKLPTGMGTPPLAGRQP